MKFRLFTLIYLLIISTTAYSQELFTESFDDNSLTSRGWYDVGSGITTSSTEKVGATGSSLEMHFSAGDTKPAGRGMRHLFSDSDSVSLSYDIKFSQSWTGSNESYHPHMFYLITNKDDKWVGPAETYLTMYVEQNEGKMLFAIQDTKNIDQANVGKDLTNTTESRSIAGCNGQADVYNDQCYLAGELYRNEKKWKASTESFSNQSGTTDQTQWHKVEAFVKLNTISAGKAVADGVIQVKVDGNTVIGYDNVMLRTAANADMKINQLLVGPYIGNGSPVDQTLWIDNLSVANSLSSLAKPKSPSQFQVVE